MWLCLYTTLLCQFSQFLFPTAAVAGGTRRLVQGNYLYYHYMQEGFNDDVCHESYPSLVVAIDVDVHCIWCAGLGVCLSVPPDAVVVVSPARVHRQACATAQRDPGNAGQGGGQGTELLGIPRVDWLLRGQHCPQPATGGESVILIWQHNYDGAYVQARGSFRQVKLLSFLD